jgi:hypothetical protein
MTWMQHRLRTERGRENSHRGPETRDKHVIGIARTRKGVECAHERRLRCGSRMALEWLWSTFPKLLQNLFLSEHQHKTAKGNQAYSDGAWQVVDGTRRNRASRGWRGALGRVAGSRDNSTFKNDESLNQQQKRTQDQ